MNDNKVELAAERGAKKMLLAVFDDTCTNNLKYFDINEGFSKHIEKMKEVQKVAATVDPDLINDATLLRMGVESMCHCGLFEKALNYW